MQQDQEQLIQTGKFKIGVLDCCDQCCLCCTTSCFPCFTLGSIKKKIDQPSCQGCCCYLIFPCCVLCQTRDDVRKSRGIDGNCFEDCFASFFCHFCTLHQMAVEVGASPGKFICD